MSEELPLAELSRDASGKPLKDVNKDVLAKLAFDRTTEEYLAMCDAIEDKSQRSGPAFQQPWLAVPATV